MLVNHFLGTGLQPGSLTGCVMGFPAGGSAGAEVQILVSFLDHRISLASWAVRMSLSLIVVWEISAVTGGVLDPNTNGIIPGMDVPESPRGAGEGSEPISPCSHCLALMSLQQDQLCRHPVREMLQWVWSWG